jgi:hypothetical protein
MDMSLNSLLVILVGMTGYMVFPWAEQNLLGDIFILEYHTLDLQDKLTNPIEFLSILYNILCSQPTPNIMQIQSLTT